MDQHSLSRWLKKYRYVLLVLLAGMVFMLLPENTSKQTEQPEISEQAEDMESRLERILGQIQGAGEVAVMLTESSAEEILYQCDGEDTVLITAADRAQQGLVRTRAAPVFRGAVIVCSGADSAAVRLAVVEAVANVTGLGTDRITVLKMK